MLGEKLKFLRRSTPGTERKEERKTIPELIEEVDKKGGFKFLVVLDGRKEGKTTLYEAMKAYGFDQSNYHHPEPENGIDKDGIAKQPNGDVYEYRVYPSFDPDLIFEQVIAQYSNSQHPTEMWFARKKIEAKPQS